MNNRTISRSFRGCALAVIVALLVTSVPAGAFALNTQTLGQDLAYYRKVAQEKSLNTNDRYYILLRIEDKYKNSGVSLKRLYAEMKKLDTSVAVPAAEKRTPRTALPAAGSVDTLRVSETETGSEVTVTAQGVSRYNYFLLKDPESQAPSKIVLDLYGVEENLPDSEKDLSLANGFFSRVQAGQFEDRPNRIVRIVAQLRTEKPYHIRHADSSFVIAVDKEAAPPAETMSGAEPEAAAPVPSSEPEPEAPAPAGKPRAATSDSYQIEAADVLSVTVYPAEELSRDVIVQPDGKITFPLIGTRTVKSMTIGQMEDMLTRDLGKFIANPQVTISVKQFSRRQVFITGEVRSVGAYSYKENLRLLEFISSVGGFTESANRKEVKVYRGPPTKRRIHMINVEEIIRSGDFSKDFLLEPGDIIEVAKGQAKVAILGDVHSPGYYDYRDNLQLMELVSLAGGFTENAKISQVTVIRPNAAKAQKVNLKNILSGKERDVEIKSGDTVYIPKTNLASANWFINNILPWLSLVSLILVIRGGV